MMKRIKNILKIVTDIGIDEQLNITEKYRIRFINGLHFLIAIILLIGITHWIILDKKPFTYIELFCLSLSIVGFVLNKLHLFKWSSVLFYLYCNFLIVYNIEFYPKEIAGYVYYFPFAMVLGINNMSVIKDSVSYRLLLLSFIIFVFVVFVDFSAIIPQAMVVQFSEDEIIWVRNFNIAIAGLCVIFFTYFYMWLANAQTTEIKQYIEKEKALQQDLLQSLNQKDTLLAEVHHRVKNNLAVLNSIINMNINNHNGKNVEGILQSLQNRIHNMSIIHNLFYQHESLESFSLQHFIQKVVQATIQQHRVQNIKIIENYDVLNGIKLDAIIPFGIALNEIISNALTHAFEHHPSPELNINVYKYNDDVVVNMSDNGKGIDLNEKDGLGMELIRALVEQINGSVTFNNSKGLCVKLNIPSKELLANI